MVLGDHPRKGHYTAQRGQDPQFENCFLREMILLYHHICRGGVSQISPSESNGLQIQGWIQQLDQQLKTNTSIQQRTRSPWERARENGLKHTGTFLCAMGSLHLSGQHSRKDVEFNANLSSSQPFAGSVTLGQLLPNHAPHFPYPIEMQQCPRS